MTNRPILATHKRSDLNATKQIIPTIEAAPTTTVSVQANAIVVGGNPSAGDVIGALVNPSYVHADTQLNDLQLAARALGRQIHVVNASNESDIDAAYATLTQRRVGALLVTSIPIFTRLRYQLVALAATHAIPAIYGQREFVTVGGLMSYGTNLADAYRKGGVYTGRILKGEKPADLPVEAPVKFEMTINLKTAKALGLDVPPTLLARADEVIE